MDIDSLIEKLTIEEKAALVSGTDFLYTNPVPRLGIPSLAMADGPHGLRKQIGGGDNGISRSEAATSFPTAAAIASSWDPACARELGAAIAKECRHYGVGVLLGPGVNIKRNPLCGRNFEYYSEDPLVAGELGAAFVEGAQSQSVGVSVKHFAANNSENYRFMGESVVDERALREIYLRAFEMIVKKARPASLMCAYNKIDGEFCSENRRLLGDILREEWGFDGLVMTDWGATHDRIKGLQAGLDLEMPGDTPWVRARVASAARSGELPPDALDAAVANVLALVDAHASPEPLAELPIEEHHELAGRLAIESAVLLKNDGALPIASDSKPLFVGALFERMRYQGAGSSMINPTKVTSPKEAFDARGFLYAYERGYEEFSSDEARPLLEAIGRSSSGADRIVFFGGLTDVLESEGHDRDDMRLPRNQIDAIEACIATGKPVTLVLFGGAPVELPFADRVAAILNMYLPGQNGGSAVAALLLGEASPCGKLAETWPLRYGDVAFGDEYSRGPVELYRESVFVGYRYYATAGKKVRYPFGHGLSYGSFSYAALRSEAFGGKIVVSCDITNNGKYHCAEIVQLYVRKDSGAVIRPLRELRAFTKVWLRPGETRRAVMAFDAASLSFYGAAEGRWVLEGGSYVVELGASSEDIRLSAEIEVPGEDLHEALCASEALRSYGSIAERGALVADDAAFASLLGRPLPAARQRLPLTMESPIKDFSLTPLGRAIAFGFNSATRKRRRAALKMPIGVDRDNALKGALFLGHILDTNSLRSLSMSAGPTMPLNLAEGLVAIANGRILSGLRHIALKVEAPRLPKDAASITDRDGR
jgi:Beta-glucosidase-related glycosidases